MPQAAVDEYDLPPEATVAPPGASVAKGVPDQSQQYDLPPEAMPPSPPHGVAGSLAAEWNPVTLAKGLWGFLTSNTLHLDTADREKDYAKAYHDNVAEAADKIKKRDYLGAANVFVSKLPGMDTIEQQWQGGDKPGAATTALSELGKMYLLKKASDVGEFSAQSPGAITAGVKAGTKAAARDVGIGTAKVAAGALAPELMHGSPLGYVVGSAPVFKGAQQIMTGIGKGYEAGKAALNAAQRDAQLAALPPRSAPAWQAGPGFQPGAPPDIQPQPIEPAVLPSGRVPGSIAAQDVAPPPVPPARTPIWQGAPGFQPEAQPALQPTQGALPSGRVPGSAARQQELFNDTVRAYQESQRPPAMRTVADQAVQDAADLAQVRYDTQVQNIIWQARMNKANALAAYFDKRGMTPEQVRNLTPEEWRGHAAFAGVNEPQSPESVDMTVERMKRFPSK